MPSRKGTEQALTWLRSKAAEKDSLDGINAEVCLNVILDLKRQNERLGALYHNAVVKSSNDILRDKIQIDRIQKLIDEELERESHFW